MADTTAQAGERNSRRQALSRSPYAWIRKRARRLARAYNLTRREALKNAFIDFQHFNPNTAVVWAKERAHG